MRQPIHFGFRLATRTDADRPLAAPLGQFRQGLQCQTGAGIVAQQAMKGDRTDVLAADELQPGQAFCVAEDRSLLLYHYTIWRDNSTLVNR